MSVYHDGVKVSTPSNDYLRIPAGLAPGYSTVNKFGRSTNVDSGVNTDIWDRANATNDQDIWVAPTQARTHQIVSSSTSDDGDPAGVGARTIRIYGLTSWTSDEVSEDITMNGTSNVATSNSYVIIHRMKVLTKGATNVNVGLITATADINSTVTAQINAGQGQTQMAIYGVPSTKVAYVTCWYVSFNTSGAAAGRADASFLANPEPNSELTNFLVKGTHGLVDDGSSHFQHFYDPYNKYEGPCILKIQAVGSANNLDVSAGFDLILENA